MGGAERHVCDLADQFSQKGHRVLIISMTGEIVNKPQSVEVEIVSLNMVKTLCSFFRAYRQARQIINIFQPNIVHSHMVHANIFSRLLNLSSHLPKLICTAHSINEGGGGRTLAYRLTDSLCDLSTNVSQEAVDVFIKNGVAPASRIIAMHNGIDIDRFTFNMTSRIKLRAELNCNDDTLLLLAVGRLTPAKDYPNLLIAFRKLSTVYKNAKLVIIGVGEEQARLTAIVAELMLIERVHFLGLRQNVHEWMSAADLYVMSSAWEGMPLVLLEAMACERVVVATDCGGVKEVVGDTGILVPAKDSVALAQGLAQGLALTREAASAQGRLARQRIVARYSLSVQAERWLELYQK